MRTYSKTYIPEFIRIKSVISVFRSSELPLMENAGEAHSFWEFLYVEKGDISILVDGKLFTLSKGNLIIYEPNSYHIVSSSHNVTINVVSFETDSPAMRDFSSNVISIDEHQFAAISEIISLGKDALTNSPRSEYDGGMLAREEASPAALQRLSNKLELLLIDLYERDRTLSGTVLPPRDDRFIALMDFLRQHTALPLTLDDISSSLSISISALHRLCKRECGCGPIDIFISLKIGEAKRMISQGKLNFTQISEKLNFSSIHYFSKLFKQKTGMSPSEYAKSIGR